MKNGCICTFADVAFLNGSVVTINEKDDIAQGLAVVGNKIACVGSDEEVQAWIGPDTRIIDLAGRSLIPGFIDTHYHPILKGFFGDNEDAAIINTNLANCPSIEDILELIRKAAAKRGPGAWISMMGYDQNTIKEKRHITLEELDAAAPDNPVQCMRTCGHICIYNSKALESIGVTRAEDAAKHPHDEIVVENGKLTGMVKDHTHFLVWSHVVYTEEQQIAAAMKSNDLLLRNGIT